MAYMILYCEEKNREDMYAQGQAFPVNSKNSDRINIVDTLLTYEEAIAFSPVSTEFEEFTKHFWIVITTAEVCGMRLWTGIPANQEILFDRMKNGDFADQ